MPPRELIAMAEACGYDAVFVTDHGKIWGRRELAGLREFCTSVQVFPGIEIALDGGIDLLVLGACDPIYETLSSPSEVFARACADGCLTVIAHPFRWNDSLPDFCALADAVEVLTCNHPTPLQAEAAREYAKKMKMAEVFSSDAHGVNFMNRFWLETDEPFLTPQEFRKQIIAGRYRNCSRHSDAPLPPTYKAAGMDELNDTDLAGLAAHSGA